MLVLLIVFKIKKIQLENIIIVFLKILNLFSDIENNKSKFVDMIVKRPALVPVRITAFIN